MRAFFCLLLVAALALVMADVAFAEEGQNGERARRPGARLKALFKRLDADESGTLTANEVPEALWERLSKADADGDGAVSKEEARKACKKKKRRGRRGGPRGGGQGGGTGAGR